jgi:hypothetical protein
MLTHAKRIGFVVSNLAKNFCATFSRASSGHSVNLQKIACKDIFLKLRKVRYIERTSR